eukprot:GEMP01050300.1.p1 GENE.GEMP01050300.1~~GEMP01050300.1.p1  ORF type:complete len:105 (+),score=3.70 GEMP01050300.1:1272-1586(+)
MRLRVKRLYIRFRMVDSFNYAFEKKGIPKKTVFQDGVLNFFIVENAPLLSFLLFCFSVAPTLTHTPLLLCDVAYGNCNLKRRSCMVDIFIAARKLICPPHTPAH